MAPEGGDARAAAGDHTERRAGRALLALLLLFYAYVVPRGPDHNPDSRHALTYALVERGTLVVDEYIGTTLDRAVRGGRIYSDKAPGVSFWLAPLYALVRLLPLSAPPGDRFLTRYLLTFFGIGVPAAVFTVWFFHWLRWACGAVTPRWLGAVALALGSPVYAYSVRAFGHVPAGICLFAGAALLRGAPLGAGLLLGAAAAFEYTALVPVALIVVWGAARRPAEVRWTFTSRISLGLAPPLLALAAYHTLAFGAPWRTGYAFVDPAGPYAVAQSVGVLGVGWPDPRVTLELLVGQKRGLLVVAPWVALSVAGVVLGWRRGGAWREWVIACGLVFTPLLAINSGYVLWDGGASWGPRHLTPALPFLAVTALPALARWPRAASAVVLLSATLTTASVLTGTLPPPDASSTLGDFVLPALRGGDAGNSLGGALGLPGWWAALPLTVAASIALVSVSGWRPSRGPHAHA